MYSTARKMVTIGAIVSALNIFGAILFTLVTMSLNLEFAVRFAMIMYIFTSSGVCLLLTLGLRSLCQDLEFEYEDDNKKFSKLEDRVKDLEHKD